MLKQLCVVVGLVLLGGAAHAQEACDGRRPGADPVAEFQRLLDCAKQGVAEAKAKLGNLDDLRFADFAAAQASQRGQFEALLTTQTAALDKARADITALVAERDQLSRDLTDANARNEEAEARIAVLQGEIERLAAEVKQTSAENQEAQAKISALQAVIDQMSADIKAAKEQIATLTTQIDELTAELMKAAEEAKARGEELGRKIDQLTTDLGGANGTIATLGKKIDQLTSDLTGATETIAALGKKIEALTAALNEANRKNEGLTKAVGDATQQITALTLALCLATEKVDALTSRLAPYSAQFALGLKQVLTGRNDVFLDGNRVIVVAEVLFPTGSAELSKVGVDTVNKAAAFLKDFAPQVPADLTWWLQVNGHTDIRPIRTKKFPSNWELSTARALSVLKQFLKDPKVPAEHLAAAGFGQYQPLAPGNNPEVLRHNRRIEMEITGTVTPPAPAPSACAPKS